MRHSNGRTRWIAGLLFAAVFSSSFASEAPERRRWALIIHDGAQGRAAAEMLAAALRDSYGFSDEAVVERYGPTLDDIRGAMELISESIRGGDSLFVHLSLPIAGNPFDEPRSRVAQQNLKGSDPGTLYLLPADHRPEEPWTWLDLEEVFRWLNSLPGGARLVTYPWCETNRYFESPFETAFRGRWEDPVEALQVCDLQSLRLLRSSSVERPEFPPDFRRGLFSERFADLLRQAAETDRPPLSTPEVAENLSDFEGFIVRLQVIPSSAFPRFKFVPTPPIIAPYRTRYESGDPESAMSQLARAAAQDDSLRHQAVEFLKNVAVDERALLPEEVARDRKDIFFLELRLRAVELLAPLGPESPGALNEIIRHAPAAAVRGRAVTALSRLKGLSAEDAEGIRAALQDQDPTVREAAIRGIAVSKDEGGIESLSELVVDRHNDSGIRAAALQTLSTLRGSRYEPLFRGMLADPDPVVRREAARALGRGAVSGPSLEALAERVRLDQDDDVRQAAASALGNSDADSSRRLVERTLREALERGPDNVREAAAVSLGMIGGANAGEMLRHALRQDWSEPVLIAAAEAVGRLRLESALPELRSRLEADSVGLRRAVVTALGAIGTREAISLMLSRANDPSPYVRAAVSDGFARVEHLTPEAAGSANLGEAPPEIRIQFIEKLSAQPEPGNLGILIESLNDDDSGVRQAAVRGLGAYRDPESVERILDALLNGPPLKRLGAAQVLRLSDLGGHESIVPALRRAARDGNGAVAVEAVYALAKRGGDERALQGILAAAETRDSAVRRAVAEALGPFAHDERVYELLVAMAKEDPSVEVRKTAITSLSMSRQKR